MVHPLPESLRHDDVVQILHDHSLLARILWPDSCPNVQGEPDSFPTTSKFIVEQGRSIYTAILCSLTNGVTCTEELPMGFKITNTFIVARVDQLPEEEQNARSKREAAASNIAPVDCASTCSDYPLFLVEERSVDALKPAMLVMNWKDGEAAVKTQNLLHILSILGESGKDVSSALSYLHGSEGLHSSNLSLEKVKNV